MKMDTIIIHLLRYIDLYFSEITGDLWALASQK